MNNKITLFFLILFFPAFADSAVFKCVDSDGKVKFKDKPCDTAAEGQETQVKNTSDYTSALQRVMLEQMKSRGIADTPKNRKLVKPIVKASALKVYTRLQIMEEMVSLCTPFLTDLEVDIRANFTKYKKFNEDQAVVGKRVFDTGFEYEGVKFTYTELRERVAEGKAEQRERYTESKYKRKKDIVKACEKQNKIIVGATKYGL